MEPIILYISGGIKYSLPTAFLPSYGLVQLRFVFSAFLLCYFFEVPYTVGVMALSVLLADLRFYLDFIRFVDRGMESYEEEEDEEDPY
tara:strand:- start:429 stop:692 length:264 start_codon:yes stop_codon:yes gene_type:complete